MVGGGAGGVVPSSTPEAATLVTIRYSRPVRMLGPASLLCAGGRLGMGLPRGQGSKQLFPFLAHFMVDATERWGGDGDSPSQGSPKCPNQASRIMRPRSQSKHQVSDCTDFPSPALLRSRVSAEASGATKKRRKSMGPRRSEPSPGCCPSCCAIRRHRGSADGDHRWDQNGLMRSPAAGPARGHSGPRRRDRG